MTGQGGCQDTREFCLLLSSRWNKWALSRGKRELPEASGYPIGLASLEDEPVQSFVRPLDVRGASRSPKAR